MRVYVWCVYIYAYMAGAPHALTVEAYPIEMVHTHTHAHTSFCWPLGLTPVQLDNYFLAPTSQHNAASLSST